MLEAALQRALAIRLNLQISLSKLAIVEERMDIQLDRWLEHNPPVASFSASLGSDLRRLRWSAWGDPREFVPAMAAYFKLCNMPASDAAILDQAGEMLEPTVVGSWIGVWGGKVYTGWQFCDPQPWAKVEAMFGAHEAKQQLAALGITRVERFAQSIGDGAFSELEVTATGGFEALADAPVSATRLSMRIRGGKIVKVGAIAAPVELGPLCASANVALDDQLAKLAGSIGPITHV